MVTVSTSPTQNFLTSQNILTSHIQIPREFILRLWSDVQAYVLKHFTALTHIYSTFIEVVFVFPRQLYEPNAEQDKKAVDQRTRIPLQRSCIIVTWMRMAVVIEAVYAFPRVVS